VPGIGYDSCTVAKHERSKENQIKVKKRTRAEEENMIHRSFLKSAQLFKLNEKRLFDKMEHRLEEE
jgi:hypothetical protein